MHNSHDGVLRYFPVQIYREAIHITEDGQIISVETHDLCLSADVMIIDSVFSGVVVAFVASQKALTVSTITPVPEPVGEANSIVHNPSTIVLSPYNSLLWTRGVIERH